IKTLSEKAPFELCIHSERPSSERTTREGLPSLVKTKPSRREPKISSLLAICRDPYYLCEMPSTDTWQGLPYFPISQFYKARFGAKVYKIPVSTATTCPNREGLNGMKTCNFCDVWG